VPKVSGKDLISDTTDKVIRRAMIVASSAVLVKMYDVPLGDLEVLGMKLPASLVDTVLLVLLIYYMYSLTINWLGDLAAFRLWYAESSIRSEFGTDMKLDHTFIRGSVPLMRRLYLLEQGKGWPTKYDELSDDIKAGYADFKSNVELYTVRLEHAGTKFSALTWFGRYYVWLQSFVFPMLLCAFALYLLWKYGSVAPPHHL